MSKSKAVVFGVISGSILYMASAYFRAQHIQRGVPSMPFWLEVVLCALALAFVVAQYTTFGFEKDEKELFSLVLLLAASAVVGSSALELLRYGFALLPMNVNRVIFDSIAFVVALVFVVRLKYEPDESSGGTE